MYKISKKQNQRSHAHKEKKKFRNLKFLKPYIIWKKNICIIKLQMYLINNYNYQTEIHRAC